MESTLREIWKFKKISYDKLHRVAINRQDSKCKHCKKFSKNIKL